MKLSEANYREQFIRSANLAAYCQPLSDRKNETRFEVVGGITYKICWAAGETRGNYTYWFFQVPKADLKRTNSHFVVVACGILGEFVVLPSIVVLDHIEKNSRRLVNKVYKLDLAMSDTGYCLTGDSRTVVEEFKMRFDLVQSRS